MVRLRRRVLQRWHELSAESHKASVELLLRSRLDPSAATEALSLSLTRVLREFERAHGIDERFAGEWSVAPVPEGALLFGGRKSDAFEDVVQAIADDLGSAGIRGTLDLYELPEVPRLPATTGVVEARVRVLGKRVANGRDRWAAERSALGRVVEAAAWWCLQVRPDRGIVLQDGAMPALLVRRCDSPLARLRAVLEDSGWVTLRSVGDECFRSVTVAPGEGRVTVAEGGPALHRAGWHPPVDAIAALLRRVAADAVYALVRRAPSLSTAELESARPTDRLRRSWLDATAYEDRRAPDAFGVQLLGPAYAGRAPSGGDWRTTELAAGRVLLEHADPAAWFGEPTLEQALRGESIPTREVLEAARASLAPILFVDATEQDVRREREWSLAHPYVRLPEGILAKVEALPQTRYVGHREVALVLRDGTVVEEVELGFGGEIVTRVAGRREFSLDPDDVVDVRSV